MNNPNILVRSSYTFFNSLLNIKDIVNLSISKGFNNSFLIDRNIMYGSMEFYLLCIKKGIKPIIGLQIDYGNNKDILIAKNLNGYKELMKISSDIQLEKYLNIDMENLFVFSHLVSYVLYENPDDIETLKDFYSISGGKDFKEPSSHFLSREEFTMIYGENIIKEVDMIINNVNLNIPEKINILPSFQMNGSNVEPKIFLEDKLKNNLMILLNADKSLDREEYIKRCSIEMKVISNMNFESYFLIVADIIEWSRSKDIFVGPGRGSAPGSLVSYLMSITTIDPIKNNLLFERFLNSERISMPDIDIDFEDSRRDEVIEYIAHKYGKDNVAQIITYQTLRARMSFKDMARIRGLSSSETNLITKLIPEDTTLREAYKVSKAFKEKIDSSNSYFDVYESAKLIEGLPRQYSTHAAGIVLSDEKIFKSVPIQNGYGKILQTQYSMDYMEYNGLLKIDILGLRNLSFIKETIKLIKLNKGFDIILDDISFEDDKVYKLLSSGKTSGIFQLESPGMRSALKEIGVSKFEDVVATTSLFRPGPMKMISEFAKRKKGIIKIEYINNDIKKILESTYGIIVYQEQIMKIVQVMSNFSLSKADILRRAIGKKNVILLESLKDEFFKGAIENNISKEDYEKTYNLIYEFSNYGFNRSHAFAYTTISYWLAWIKINYPLEFMSSLLNSSIGNVAKISSYISECEDMGIIVKIPSILYSKEEFIISGEDIIMGLKNIKKIGESIIKKIVTVQDRIESNISLIDILIEFDRAGITQTVIEILVKSNCFSSWGFNKQTLINFLPKMSDYINMIKVTIDGVISFDKSIIPEPTIEIFKPINEKEFFLEVIGFSLGEKESIKEFQDIISRKKIIVDNLEDMIQDKKVIFIGEIISIKELTTKTGKKMAFIKITNRKRKIDLIFWPGTFEKYNSILSNGKIFIFFGSIDLKRGESIIINMIDNIEDEK